MGFVEIDCSVDRLVVVAPTGSGKTYAVIKNVPCYLERCRRVFFTLPTKALMSEVSKKLTSLGIEHLVDNSDVRLTENISIDDWVKSRVIVASYEKVDSVLLLHPWLAKDSLIVIDEVHLATDIERALAILSLLATAKRVGAGVIVMSATIPNYRALAEYLGAELLVRSDSVVERKIVFEDLRYVPRNTSSYLYAMTRRIEWILCRDKEEYGCVLPTIVFRPCRKHCEIIAELLRESGFVAAAYHSGVPVRERVRLLKEFNEGKIDVLVSTHALCWGVNTVAMRVIIAGSLIYRPDGPHIFLKTVDVVQMAGRAGRPGYISADIVPEVVIITTSGDLVMDESGDYVTERYFFERAVREDYAEAIGLRGDPGTVVLRLVRAGRVRSVGDVERIPAEWFNVPPREEFLKALDELSALGLIEIKDNEIKEIKLTKMGLVVSEHYLTLEEFRAIKEEVLDVAPESRLEKLVAVSRAVGRLNRSRLKVPDSVIDDLIALSIADVEALEIVAQLLEPTGDTDRIAESIKKFAFFLNRVYQDVYGKADDDWYVLGKAMKQLRSMLHDNLPINGIVKMYVDGVIDRVFKVEEKENT